MRGEVFVEREVLVPTFESPTAITVLTSCSYFPVFSNPTATLEVVGNTGNPSSEKAGVGRSIPSLPTSVGRS
jgi:hypothetical protein